MEGRRSISCSLLRQFNDALNFQVHLQRLFC